MGHFLKHTHEEVDTITVDAASSLCPTGVTLQALVFASLTCTRRYRTVPGLT